MLNWRCYIIVITATRLFCCTLLMYYLHHHWDRHLERIMRRSTPIDFSIVYCRDINLSRRHKRGYKKRNLNVCQSNSVGKHYTHVAAAAAQVPMHEASHAWLVLTYNSL